MTNTSDLPKRLDALVIIDEVHSDNQLGKEAAARIRELEKYSDKLANSLPDGMLPKDIEVLRNANTEMAQKILDLENNIEQLISRINALQMKKQ